MTDKRLAKRPLSIPEILAWADAHKAMAGRWPTVNSGVILHARFECWRNVDQALRQGLRGLPGGISLAKLLAEHRGVRNIQNPSSLTVEQILRWADEYHERMGKWPTTESGKIPSSGTEKWKGVDRALRCGIRGLPGGSSLSLLLSAHRGHRARTNLPPLSEEQILQWADAYHRQTDRWPNHSTGPISEDPSETWKGVDMALRTGSRGLPGGSGLGFLLADQRGVRNAWSRPSLSIVQILEWADNYFQRTGRWPKANCGRVVEAPDETWKAINLALFKGGRGLPGGSSLARLLEAERGRPNRLNLPRLTHRQILIWADDHHRRTGSWPTRRSGTITAAPEETWLAVDDNLREGSRGLRSGSSLARLLASQRGVRNPADLPRLSKKKIIAWADAHFQRTGSWPTTSSGDVDDAPGEKWQQIDQSLRIGRRGLAGGTSLTRLLIAKGRLPKS